MPPHARALACASVSLLTIVARPARAEDEQRSDVVVTAQKQPTDPGSRASIDAAAIKTTVNALNVEDTVKYLPSLIVRKRHIGDTQAPLATRTTGLGASARSLIYADGVLLSALIGNNNTYASPRWSLVAPQEIEQIDVLYGPFSAAYPGNSIGAVVNITTRLPQQLEATATAGANVQRNGLYGMRRSYPSYQFGATLGDRIGPLSLIASLDHVDSRGQPLLYVTAPRPTATSAAGILTTGGIATVNRTGVPVRVLGASGIEHQRQDRLKLKTSLDLGGGMQATYTGALFLNDTNAAADTYLTAESGAPTYAGTLNLDGRAYPVAASAFSGGVYRQDQRHWLYALSVGGPGWQVIGTRYRFARDVQRSPTTALPGALTGGAGTITRLDGTGWRTLDAKGSVTPGGGHRLTVGGHVDRYDLRSGRFTTADWLVGPRGALNLRSRGSTRTAAVWAEDTWAVAPSLTVTLGGRQEWWRSFGGINTSLIPPIDVRQPERNTTRFSPKVSASLQWLPGWTVRASFGAAWRFPTVGELYQVVTTPVPSVPDPNLRPEHARSEELALERSDAHGSWRLSLFNEVVEDALVSQNGPLAGTVQLGTFVQNVERTRARGVEAAWQRTDLLPGVDLSGSATYADAVTRADGAFPAAVGKRMPGVPRWKATLVGTWRPAAGVSLTAAGRYASRIYGTLDNSDPVAFTYQGFGRYLVIDLRAAVRVGRHYTLGLGIDNVGNDRYFLFHPFPQRSFQADVAWTF